ncbi:MAG: GNAT family N-acetyltransferase [Clostridia bacterium]|nr:GNAT family N-acetyltransferase [Clostridia bacterium]
MIITDTKDIQIIKHNWVRIFGDGESFVDELFSLSPMVFALKTDGEISSSLLVIEMIYNGHKIGYIYGAMTVEKFRNCGLMKKLLDEVCETLEEKGFSGVFLLPANEKLYDYYAVCGFEKNLPTDTVTVFDMPEGTKDKVLSREEYERLEYPLKRDYDLFEFAVRTHIQNGGHTVCNDDDFIAYHIKEGQVVIDMACTKNVKRDRFAMSKCFGGFKWGNDAHVGLLME